MDEIKNKIEATMESVHNKALNALSNTVGKDDENYKEYYDIFLKEKVESGKLSMD